MEASAGLAAVGLGTTAYAVYKKQPLALVIPLGYFSSMELLQAFTYTVIDICGIPSNQIATFLGYLHIALQPFFINMISMHFVPKYVRDKVKWWVYGVCGVATTVMLFQLYPFAWAGQCEIGGYLCAQNLCSVSGNWHIAWNVPLNGLFNAFTGTILTNVPAYVLAAFFLPILYGSWRMTSYHLLVGPFLAWMLTDNPNEQPAIWCLLSIGILLIVVKTPIKKVLHVKKWPLWKWLK